MDNERKYEEALERAKSEYQAHKSFNGFREMLVHIFPELAESEDEKIRKEIINVFKSLGELKIPADINFADIFTWLEKQGDTNETISRDEFSRGVLRGAAVNLISWIDYKSNMRLSNMECKDIEDALVSGDWDKIYAYMKKKLEKQGDMKPILDIEIPFGAKDSELQEVTYSIPQGFHAEIDDDKVVIKKGKQKHTTWSEEDETNIQRALFYVNFYQTHEAGTKESRECFDWLKSLRYQNM